MNNSITKYFLTARKKENGMPAYAGMTVIL